MLKRLLLVTVATAITFANAPGSFAQRQRQSRAAAAPVATEARQQTGPLARYFPSDIFMYAEVGDLAAVVEQVGGVSYVYSLIRQAAESVGPTSSPRKLPLTEDQFRSLLNCSLALGVGIPDGAKLASSNVEPTIMGVIRTPSPEVLETLQGFVSEAAKTRADTAPKPVTSKVAGVTVTTYPDPKPGNSFAYATLGTDIIVGDSKGITKLLTGLTGAATKRLSDLPGYTSSSARVPRDRVLFAYLNGEPLVTAFNQGIDSSTAVNGKPSPSGEFIKVLLGMNALRGGSLSAVLEGGSMAIQAAVELDRAKPGLVSILSDPPPISSRGSALVPDDTDVFYSASFDLIRIYDFVLQIMTPERSKALGITPGQLAGIFEAKTGVKFREEFLAALGSEYIVASTIVQTDTMSNVSMQSAQSTPKVDYKFVALVETRNPDVITKCITSLVGSDTDQVKTETIDDVDVWSNSTVAWAYVEGFCIVGQKPDVIRTLGAIKERKTLGSTAAFAAAASTIPNNAITALYMSPAVFELAAREAEVEKNVPNALSAFPNGLFLSMQKDSDGLYTNFSVPLPNLRLLLEKEKHVASTGR